MRSSRVVAEFIGHPRESAWHSVYLDARNAVQDARVVEIQDAAVVAVGEAVDILLHVLRSAEVNGTRTAAAIEDSCQRQVQDRRMALGIAPYGESAEAAADALYERVGPAPGSVIRWIEAANNLEELRQQLADWLLTIVELRAGRAIEGTPSESILASEMPDTAAGTRAGRFRRLRGIS